MLCFLGVIVALSQQRALRTNATTRQVLHIAVTDCGYSLRSGEQSGVPQALLQHHDADVALRLEQ